MTQFMAIEEKLDKAAAAAEKTAESLDNWRAERERSDRVVRVAMVSALTLLLAVIAALVMIYQVVDDSQQTRLGNRAILQELLSYSDPNSERSKESAAQTAAVIEQLVERFSEVVERGTIDATRATLEIRRCAFGDLAEFEACIRDHLPADVFIPEDAQGDGSEDAE